jgi:hypothetical protein
MFVIPCGWKKKPLLVEGRGFSLADSTAIA